jgi:hypothetical protein
MFSILFQKKNYFACNDFTGHLMNEKKSFTRVDAIWDHVNICRIKRQVFQTEPD